MLKETFDTVLAEMLKAIHRHYGERLVTDRLRELAEISKSLRKDRELAFYSDIDFIPTEEHSIKEGQQAYEGAKRVLEGARRVIPGPY